MALDWAGFFMSIGVEIIPNYGLDVDFINLCGVKNMCLLITNVFERTY